MTEPLIAVGRALGGHGIRGEVRVRLDNETSSLLAELDAIYVGGSSGEAAPRQYRLEAARPAPRGWVLRLAGITDRNGADELAGRELLVEEHWLPPVAEGEYYYRSLIGLSVHDVQGNRLGEVVDLFDNGASDVLVIDRDGREVLIPFVDALVPEVLIAEGRLVVDPPDGLLDP